VLDRRRAARRQPEMVEVLPEDAATGFHALDAMEADETAARVRQAMGQLSPMQRDVFTLRVQEGRAYKEIAEILGTTEGAARVHYHNALRAVKEWLHD
jgi:RNA polymerase sigma-70 factor, ECF subfamily